MTAARNGVHSNVYGLHTISICRLTNMLHKFTKLKRYLCFFILFPKLSRDVKLIFEVNERASFMLFEVKFSSAKLNLQLHAYATSVPQQLQRNASTVYFLWRKSPSIHALKGLLVNYLPHTTKTRFARRHLSAVDITLVITLSRSQRDLQTLSLQDPALM